MKPFSSNSSLMRNNNNNNAAITLLSIASIFILVLLQNITGAKAADATPTRHYPEELDNANGWAGYGIYVGLSILLPVLFIIVLYITSFFVWCCRCSCQVCGGSKPRIDGYTRGEVRLCSLVFVGFFIFFSALIILAILFTILFSTTIRTVEKDTFKLVDNTETKINNVISVVDNVDSTVNETFAKIDDIFTAVDGLNTSLITINNGLLGALSDIDGVSNALGAIGSNLEDMKATVDKLANDPDLHNSPSSDMIPTIGGESSAINSSRDAIIAGMNQISTAQQNIQDINQGIRDQIGGFRTDIDDAIGGLTDQVSEPMSKVKDYMKTFDKYYGETKYYVNIVDGVRLAIFLTFWVLAFLIFALGLIGLCCGWRWSVKLTTCCTFSVPILFLIVAIIQLFLFIALTDVCREAEPAIRRSQNLIDKYIGNGGNNNNNSSRSLIIADTGFAPFAVDNSDFTEFLNVSNLVDKVLYCTKDDSLLGLIPGLDMTALNVSKYIEPFNNQVASELDKFNITGLTSEATGYLDDFSSFTSNVQMSNVTSSLNTIRSHINSVSAQLTNFTQFGYDESLSNSVLDDLNTKSHDVGGDVWSLDNVTNLDPTAVPYSSDTDYFNTTKYVLLEYKDRRDYALNRIAEISLELNELTTYINNIEAEVNKIISLINNSPNRANTIKQGINSIPTVFDDVKSSVQDVIQFATDKVKNVSDTTLALAGCEQIGDYTRSTKSNVCQQMSPYSGIIALVSFMLAILTLAWFISLLPLTKRVGNYEDSGARSMEHEMMEH